ncbi:hypothetical protein ABTZ99_01255 [Actinosynnema sp. NPDC002837]
MTLTHTTGDGRSATTSRVVQVRTHDVALGKVTFRAVASLPEGDDHLLDNEAISSTTAVRPAVTGGLDLT